MNEASDNKMKCDVCSCDHEHSAHTCECGHDHGEDTQNIYDCINPAGSTTRIIVDLGFEDNESVIGKAVAYAALVEYINQNIKNSTGIVNPDAVFHATAREILLEGIIDENDKENGYRVQYFIDRVLDPSTGFYVQLGVELLEIDGSHMEVQDEDDLEYFDPGNLNHVQEFVDEMNAARILLNNPKTLIKETDEEVSPNQAIYDTTESSVRIDIDLGITNICDLSTMVVEYQHQLQNSFDLLTEIMHESHLKGLVNSEDVCNGVMSKILFQAVVNENDAETAYVVKYFIDGYPTDARNYEVRLFNTIEFTKNHDFGSIESSDSTIIGPSSITNIYKPETGSYDFIGLMNEARKGLNDALQRINSITTCPETIDDLRTMVDEYRDKLKSTMKKLSEEGKFEPEDVFNTLDEDIIYTDEQGFRDVNYIITRYYDDIHTCFGVELIIEYRNYDVGGEHIDGYYRTFDRYDPEDAIEMADFWSQLISARSDKE